MIDGVTGLVCRGGDLQDLRQKLRSLRDDNVLAANLGRNAYDHYWNSPHTIERHTSALLRVYGEMLNKNPVVERVCA